jgi:hypothetical protein
MIDHLQKLSHGALRRFRDGIDAAIPNICCGVYSIWRGAEFIYVGHVGRAAEGAADGRRTGLADRLRHHSTGRRSGDQFCVYVGDRLVLPTLSSEDLGRIATGELLLDDFIYVFVQDELSYRYTITPNVVEARAVEAAARSGGLDAGKPFLNPLPAPVRRPKVQRAEDIRAGRQRARMSAQT